MAHALPLTITVLRVVQEAQPNTQINTNGGAMVKMGAVIYYVQNQKPARLVGLARFQTLRPTLITQLL
jgi:hypothetical protein